MESEIGTQIGNDHDSQSMYVVECRSKEYQSKIKSGSHLLGYKHSRSDEGHKLDTVFCAGL